MIRRAAEETEKMCSNADTKGPEIRLAFKEEPVYLGKVPGPHHEVIGGQERIPVTYGGLPGISGKGIRSSGRRLNRA